MIYILLGLMIGLVIGFIMTFVYIDNIYSAPTITKLCAGKFPYTNSTIDVYIHCKSNPEYYGISRNPNDN